MSHLGILVPIAICTVGPLSWVANNWIRARHGFEPETWKGRKQRRQDGSPDAERQVRLLSDENEKLVGKIGRLEERLAVLERIATDPAARITADIEALRDGRAIRETAR